VLITPLGQVTHIALLLLAMLLLMGWSLLAMAAKADGRP
jgi:hypothetical protein